MFRADEVLNDLDKMFGTHAGIAERGEDIFSGLLGLEFEAGREVAIGSETGSAGSEEEPRVGRQLDGVTVFADVF
jgi:hypothetical protein